MSKFCTLLQNLDTTKTIVVSNNLWTTDWRWCDNDPRYKIKSVVQGDDFNSAKLMIDIVHSASGELIITDEIKKCVLSTLNNDRTKFRSRRSRLTNLLRPIVLTKYCKFTETQASNLLFESTTPLSLDNVSLSFNPTRTSGKNSSYDVTVTSVDSANSILVCTNVDSQALPPSLAVLCCWVGPRGRSRCATCTIVDNDELKPCGPCQVPTKPDPRIP